MLRALVSGLPAFALSGHAADVLVSLAGLHHLPDRAARYLEAKRVLRPGGQDRGGRRTEGKLRRLFSERIHQ